MLNFISIHVIKKYENNLYLVFNSQYGLILWKNENLDSL